MIFIAFIHAERSFSLQGKVDLRLRHPSSSPQAAVVQSPPPQPHQRKLLLLGQVVCHVKYTLPLLQTMTLKWATKTLKVRMMLTKQMTVRMPTTTSCTASVKGVAMGMYVLSLFSVRKQAQMSNIQMIACDNEGNCPYEWVSYGHDTR